MAGGKHNKTEIIDRHVEELRKGKEKDNLIIILLLGSIAGCALVFLSVKIIVSDLKMMADFVFLLLDHLSCY